MSAWILEKAKSMKAKLVYSGRVAIYRVFDRYGEENQVSVAVRCTCRYHAIQGAVNGEVCSFALKALQEIASQGKLHIEAASGAEMLQAMRNLALQLVRPMNRKVNEVRVSEGEGKLHRVAKENICAYLNAVGKEFVTEAIFKEGGRADIFVLDDLQAIEVVSSESEESIEKKKARYPEGVNVVAVKVGGENGC